MRGVTNRTSPVPLVLAATTATIAVVLLVGLQGALAWLILAWMLSVPGIALVRLLRLRDPRLEGLAGVLLSVSLAGLVTLALVPLGAWSLPAVAWILIAVAAVALAADSALVPAPAQARAAEALRRPFIPAWERISPVVERHIPPLRARRAAYAAAARQAVQAATILEAAGPLVPAGPSAPQTVGLSELAPDATPATTPTDLPPEPAATATHPGLAPPPARLAAEPAAVLAPAAPPAAEAPPAAPALPEPPPPAREPEAPPAAPAPPEAPPAARRRRRTAGETAPDHLLQAPPSVSPAADDFFDGLVRRVESDR